MHQALEFLNEVPSGLWAFVGVAVGLLVNARRDKRAAEERHDIRDQETINRANLLREERLRAWRSDRMQAQVNFIQNVVARFDLILDYLRDRIDAQTLLKASEESRLHFGSSVNVLTLLASSEVVLAAQDLGKLLLKMQTTIEDAPPTEDGRPTPELRHQLGALYLEIEQKCLQFLNTARSDNGLPALPSLRGWP